MGAIEDIDLSEAQRLMDVNFFGTLRTIKAFLPRMREAGKGRIVLVGAIEGLVASPFQGIYSAAEFALEGMAQALRIEVARFGVEVGIVELASFRTGFGQGRRIAMAASENSPYRSGLESALGVIERDEAEAFDPLTVARVVAAMLSARHMPVRRTAGRLSRRVLAGARRVLAPRALDRRLRRYYRID
jgi:NAD(P)-dependent dehydrogenase (short-subunit alcohol dehydrogenase family)